MASPELAARLLHGTGAVGLYLTDELITIHDKNQFFSEEWPILTAFFANTVHREDKIQA